MPAIHRSVPVDEIADAIAGALGPDLIGLYVYGSAVSGGFEPGVSDLDLVAVTDREAAALGLAVVGDALGAFLARRPDWTDRLELVLVGEATLRDFRTSTADLAVMSPGEALHLSGPVRDWTQNWYLLRETGRILRGRDVRDVVPEVSVAEFRAAVAAYAAWLADGDLETHAPGALAYAVLSECRALCTLLTGGPCSKVEGARWLARQEPRWRAVIDAALACRRARGTAGLDTPGERAAAIELIREVARSIGTGPLAV